MSSVLFCIPLKVGALEKYEAFAAETIRKKAEYLSLLKRYDIHSAKVWHKNIANRDYIFVYHDVGPTFEEKMKGWDTSVHPFDTWFRNGIMEVYDIENAAGMETPRQLVDVS